MIGRTKDECTVSRKFAAQASKFGDKPYVFFEEQTYSFRQVDRLTNQLAHGLFEIGCRPGTHIAIVMENKADLLFLLVAIGKLGAVAVPINTAAKGEMLLYYLTQSDSTLIFLDATFLERVVEVLPRAPAIRRAVVYKEDNSLEEFLDVAKLVPTHSFCELLVEDSTPIQGLVKFSDTYLLLYTSGTTGASKANIVTHSCALNYAEQLANGYGYRQDDILYVCLPLFHGNALLCSCFPALVAGSAVAIARRFSASRFWSDIRRYNVTQFNSLGAMTNFIWSQPETPDDAKNTVRQCMVVPTPKGFFREFEKRFGLKLNSLYSLSDACVMAITRSDDPPEKWASAGRPCDNVELRIVDDDDFEVPRGMTGEIVARTIDPWVFAQGYYSMPEATVLAWRNLWFHTGDRGCLDEDGYLYFVDRKKDAIRRRGENISAFEVEQIILRHPAVFDVAVFPVTSEYSEDEVMASVVRKDNTAISVEGLIEFCARNMPYFMVPRYLEFVQALPKTMTEKVEKYKLRESAESRLMKIWDRERAGVVIQR